MLKLANPSVHTDPASTCASRVNTGQRPWPIATIATQASAASTRSCASLLKRLRSVALTSAPSMAPMPKAPSRMPKVGAPPPSRSRATIGMSAGTAAMGMVYSTQRSRIDSRCGDSMT